MVTSEAPRAEIGDKHPGLVTALRKDPGHAAELILCCVLPSLARHATKTHGPERRDAGASANREATSVVKKNTRIARHDGAFTGTSFYFGMPAAMASIFCHQVLMVLQVAAVHGHDPADPARAAEILVLRQQAPDLATAAATLRTLGTTAAERGEPKTSLTATALAWVRGLPAMARQKFAATREQGVFAGILQVLQYVAYVVPFVGMPVWAASYARATRLLGKRATEFYASAPGGPGWAAAPGSAGAPGWAGGPGSAGGPGGAGGPAGPGSPPVVWGVTPAPPLALLVGLMAVTALITFVTLYLALHSSAHHHRHLKWTAISLAAAFVNAMYARLWWILYGSTGRKRQRQAVA